MGTSAAGIKRDGGRDYAGSLIASIVIDLATKSSTKFKYTHGIRPCPLF